MMMTPMIGLVINTNFVDFSNIDSFSLNEVGRMNIFNRHKRSVNRSKHLRVDK
jgi:hypothetical protein